MLTLFFSPSPLIRKNFSSTCNNLVFQKTYFVLIIPYVTHHRVSTQDPVSVSSSHYQSTLLQFSLCLIFFWVTDPLINSLFLNSWPQSIQTYCLCPYTIRNDEHACNYINHYFGYCLLFGIMFLANFFLVVYVMVIFNIFLPFFGI